MMKRFLLVVLLALFVGALAAPLAPQAQDDGRVAVNWNSRKGGK